MSYSSAGDERGDSDSQAARGGPVRGDGAERGKERRHSDTDGIGDPLPIGPEIGANLSRGAACGSRAGWRRPTARKGQAQVGNRS
jgi:hypothetical protein